MKSNPYVYCEDCGVEMEYQDTDSRQEWVEEFYECPACHKSSTHRREFDQRGIVTFDEVYYHERNGKEFTPGPEQKLSIPGPEQKLDIPGPTRGFLAHPHKNSPVPDLTDWQVVDVAEGDVIVGKLYNRALLVYETDPALVRHSGWYLKRLWDARRRVNWYDYPAPGWSGTTHWLAPELATLLKLDKVVKIAKEREEYRRSRGEESVQRREERRRRRSGGYVPVGNPLESQAFQDKNEMQELLDRLDELGIQYAVDFDDANNEWVVEWSSAVPDAENPSLKDDRYLIPKVGDKIKVDVSFSSVDPGSRHTQHIAVGEYRVSSYTPAAEEIGFILLHTTRQHWVNIDEFKDMFQWRNDYNAWLQGEMSNPQKPVPLYAIIDLMNTGFSQPEIVYQIWHDLKVPKQQVISVIEYMKRKPGNFTQWQWAERYEQKNPTNLKCEFCGGSAKPGLDHDPGCPWYEPVTWEPKPGAIGWKEMREFQPAMWTTAELFQTLGEFTQAGGFDIKKTDETVIVTDIQTGKICLKALKKDSRAWIVMFRKELFGMENPVEMDCPSCGGTGERSVLRGRGEVCWQCKGSGIIVKSNPTFMVRGWSQTQGTYGMPVVAKTAEEAIHKLRSAYPERDVESIEELDEMDYRDNSILTIDQLERLSQAQFPMEIDNPVPSIEQLERLTDAQFGGSSI